MTEEFKAGGTGDVCEWWLMGTSADLIIRNSGRPVNRYRTHSFLVHGQVTIIFVVSVGFFVCAELFSAVVDPIFIKLMLYVWV